MFTWQAEGITGHALVQLAVLQKLALIPAQKDLDASSVTATYQEMIFTSDGNWTLIGYLTNTDTIIDWNGSTASGPTTTVAVPDLERRDGHKERSTTTTSPACRSRSPHISPASWPTVSTGRWTHRSPSSALGDGWSSFWSRVNSDSDEGGDVGQ